MKSLARSLDRDAKEFDEEFFEKMDGRGSGLATRKARGRFADLAVYTKNRAFRLYCSSKFGKEPRLSLAKTNEFPADVMGGELKLFTDSLIEEPMPGTARDTFVLR